MTSLGPNGSMFGTNNVIRPTAVKVACALCPTDGKFVTKVKEGFLDVQAVHGA